MLSLYNSTCRHLIRRVPNMSIPGNLELPTTRTLALFAILNLLYGWIYAIAWNSYLPSTVDQHLFRLTTIVVVGGGFILWASYHLERFTSEYGDKYYNPLVLIANFLEWLAVVIMGLVLLAFCMVRVFLVVEAFIIVRKFPLGVYNTVNWVSFLPHIGN